MDEVHALAASRGLRFADAEYVGHKKKHQWMCAAGHSFFAVTSNVRTGHGCPECWSLRRRTYGDTLAASAARYGWTLHMVPPRDSLGQKSVIVASCPNGHRGSFPSVRIMDGRCRFCLEEERWSVQAAKAHAEASAFAKLKGGCLLTTEDEMRGRTKSQQALDWRCEEGHTWSASLSAMKHRARWCRRCRHGELTTLADLAAHAAARGGRCLSLQYRGSHRKYQWECNVGHSWEASWLHVAHGTRTWCPHCQISPSEQVCRLIFESFFGVQFPRARPGWLVGPGGSRLELDGYNEQLALAFEHHGEQHFEQVPFFHRGSADRLLAQRQRDAAKRQRCLEHGVRLVEIRQLDLRCDYPEIIKQVVEACEAHRVFFLNVNLSLDLAPAFTDVAFEVLRARVESNGGKVLSYTGISYSTKYQCRCGRVTHLSTRAIRTLKHPGVCKQCIAGVVQRAREPAALQRNHRYVADRFAGICLDRASEKKWSFRCAAGHGFEASMGNVRQGKWCPNCRRDAKQEEILERARTLKVDLLSSAPASQQPSRWRCEMGHEFECLADSIGPTHRCPVCKAQRKSASAALQMAKARRTEEIRSAQREKGRESLLAYVSSRGGRIVAGMYETRHSEVTVECASGHQWPVKVLSFLRKNGSWCPYCAGRHKAVIDLDRIAKTTDPMGLCRSTAYLGSAARHEWECGRGHRFSATTGNVSAGSWCPECVGKKRGDMEKMHALAASHGGACISEKYLGAFRHLRWICGACEHQWDAMPTNVQSGKWCPPCGKMKAAHKRQKAAPDSLKSACT